MKPEVEDTDSPELGNDAPGRLVIQFLQEHKGGATMSEIIRYLRTTHGDEQDELVRKVENLLESGTALGFLERKGSHYVNWSAKETGCRRRRRRRSRRRRRRRSCRRRKRRRSRCRRRKPVCCCKRLGRCK